MKIHRLLAAWRALLTDQRGFLRFSGPLLDPDPDPSAGGEREAAQERVVDAIVDKALERLEAKAAEEEAERAKAAKTDEDDDGAEDDGERSKSTTYSQEQVDSMLEAAVTKTLSRVDPDNAEREKAAGAMPGAPNINKHGRGYDEEFSVIRWTQAQLSRDKSILKAPERKALSEGTNTAGGFLVFVDQVPELIELVKARSIVEQSGVRVMETQKDRREVPKRTGASTANWVGEGVSIPASDLSFGQAVATPHKVAGRVISSEELIMDADFDMEQIIRQDLGEELALAADIAYIRGDGSSKPAGVARSGNGVQKYTLENDGGNGAVPTYDDLTAMLNLIEQADGEVDFWWANPRFRDTVRGIKDSQGRPIFVDPTGPAEVPTLFGRPLRTTTKIPVNLTKGGSSDCSELIAGVARHLVIVRRFGVQIRASRETSDAFEKEQVHIKATMRVDSVIRTANQFVWADGVRN